MSSYSGGRWSYSPNRGRGRDSPHRGRGRTIAQMGNKRLIAENIANIASTSETHSPDKGDDILYKEFLEFKASRQGNTSQNPSYVHILTEDEESDDSWEQNEYKDIILILEDKDLKWKDDIWHLMNRYLTTSCYTAGSYKPRLHYENILKATNSCEFSHFYGGKQTQVYSFSKVIIKQIISAEDWGLSTLGEKEYFRSDQKIQVKFNYWDYIQAFHKCFLYENNIRKHTWFFKICPQVFTKDVPNWLYQWWLSYGPSLKILPSNLKELYSEWVESSPILIEAEVNNKWIEGMPSLYFFMEFGIPWIWKWEPEMGYTQQNLPCIKRVFYTKFWKKMMRKNEHGIIEGQQTIEEIQGHILEYKSMMEKHMQRTIPSPFQQISRKLNFQQGKMTKQELIASYMEEVKKDLLKNFGSKTKSDTSMAGSSHEDEEFCLPGEAQDPFAEEADVSIEEMVNRANEFIFGPNKDSSGKDKDKIDK